MSAYMITGRKLSLGLLLVSLACNSQKASPVDSDTTVIAQAMPTPEAAGNAADQELMKRIDSAVGTIKNGGYATRTAYFPPNNIHDTLKTTLFFRDGKAVRIQYSTFEDGGAAVGNDELYFEKSLGIIKVSEYTNGVFYVCITFDGRYIQVRKSPQNGALERQDIPEAAIDGWAGFLLRKAHDLRQLYPDIKFDIPEVPLDGSAALKIMSAIPLYEGPDTNTRKIKLLDDNSTAGFIRASDSIGTFGNKKWIWYFVRSYTDSGWIVGHPDFVQELTDENTDEGAED